MTDPATGACEAAQDGTPSCSTGPLGRLRWTGRELADLVRAAWRWRRAR